MRSMDVYFRKILWQQLEAGLECGVAAEGRSLDGCGQTGIVTHAGSEEGRSLGRLSNPWLSLLSCLLLAFEFLPFISQAP